MWGTRGLRRQRRSHVHGSMVLLKLYVLRAEPRNKGKAAQEASAMADGRRATGDVSMWENPSYSYIFSCSLICYHRGFGAQRRDGGDLSARGTSKAAPIDQRAPLPVRHTDRSDPNEIGGSAPAASDTGNPGSESVAGSSLPARKRAISIHSPAETRDFPENWLKAK
jgi:hypothetical protein